MRLTVEELAGSSVRFIESLARTVERLATGLVYFVTIPAALSIVLTVWMVRGVGLLLFLGLAGVVGGIGLAAALVARGRFRAVTRRAPQLAREMHDLLVDDPSAREAIDTYIVDDGEGERIVADLNSPQLPPQGGGMIRSARKLIRVRRFVGDNMDRFSTVTAAVSAAKVGPWLILVATAAAVYLTTLATTLLLTAILRLVF